MTVSFSESAMGDIMEAGGAGMLGGATAITAEEQENLPSAVAVIHDDKKKAFARDYSDYTEGEAIKIRPPLGEGRKSEFTGKSGLSTVHGYRASILSNDRGRDGTSGLIVSGQEPRPSRHRRVHGSVLRSRRLSACS